MRDHKIKIGGRKEGKEKDDGDDDGVRKVNSGLVAIEITIKD